MTCIYTLSMIYLAFLALKALVKLIIFVFHIPDKIATLRYRFLVRTGRIKPGHSSYSPPRKPATRETIVGCMPRRPEK